jgi:phosphoribosylanthranilate isomerase
MNVNVKNIQDETNFNSPLGVGGRLGVKICGMKFPENIRSIADLQLDFMGFIFNVSNIIAIFA